MWICWMNMTNESRRLQIVCDYWLDCFDPSGDWGGSDSSKRVSERLHKYATAYGHGNIQLARPRSVTYSFTLLHRMNKCKVVNAYFTRPSVVQHTLKEIYIVLRAPNPG